MRKILVTLLFSFLIMTTVSAQAGNRDLVYLGDSGDYTAFIDAGFGIKLEDNVFCILVIKNNVDKTFLVAGVDINEKNMEYKIVSYTLLKDGKIIHEDENPSITRTFTKGSMYDKAAKWIRNNK